MRLGPDNARRERQLLTDLLGADVADPQAALAERIRTGDDPAFEAGRGRRSSRSPARTSPSPSPGHDAWEGA